MTFKKLAGVAVFALSFFMIAPRFVHAAAYTATDVLGQVNSTNHSLGVFDKDTPNDGPSNLSLYIPGAMTVDEVDHRLFIVDRQNNRVVVYALDSTNAIASRVQSFVLGQVDFDHYAATTTASSLHLSQSIDGGVAYDAVNHRLFVSDTVNNRILVYDATPGTLANGEAASFVLGQTDFISNGFGTTSSTLHQPSLLAYDASSTRLFATDQSNNRVLVYNVAVAELSNGKPASFVLGEPDFISNNGSTGATGVYLPKGMAYDPINNRLFVADADSRVLIFNVASGTLSNHMSASFALGNTDLVGSGGGGTSSSTFGNQAWLAYDAGNSRLFVADQNSQRILIFNVASGTVVNDKPASFVLGQADFVSSAAITPSTSSSISRPPGIAYETVGGHLFVATANHSVMVFVVASGTVSNNKAASDLVGQLGAGNAPVFSKTGFENGPNDMGLNPYELNTAIDTVHHRLFVQDDTNNRVVVYTLDASNNISSRVQSHVLGQPDLYTGTASTTQALFTEPVGLAYDDVNDRLFVADATNNRVLIFDTSAVTDGMSASFVLGQNNFVSSTAGTTSTTMSFPDGIAYDAAHNRLFVGEQSNSRISIWDVSPGTVANGEPASFVLGQSAFTTANTGVGSSTFASGFDVGPLAFDAVDQRLFAVDNGDNRVLIWNLSNGITNGMPASYVLGQSTFNTTSSGTTQASFNYPNGLTYDASSTRLFVLDTNNNRALVFDVATNTITNGESASFVLGQSDFTSLSHGVSQSALNNPQGSGSYDPAHHRLYLGDAFNSRILVYDLLALTSASLSTPIVGASYSATGLCTTANGQGTVSCGISGTLPAGLTFDPVAGTLSGTPTAKGSYSFSVIASDTVSGIGSISDRISYALAVQGALPDNTIVASYGAGGGGGGGSSGSPVVTPPATPTPSSTPANPSSTPSAPSTPSSPEASALQAQIQVLLTKIAELKAQLGIPTGTGAGSGTPIPNLTLQFTRNLTLGSSGDDVKALQEFLADQASGPAAAALKAHGTTHLFGPLTKAALAEWQKAHGISPASGFFGPLTRSAVNAAH